MKSWASKLAIGCWVALVAFTVSGCGQAEHENVKSQPIGPMKKAKLQDKVAESPVFDQLVGVWLGVASIDEEKLIEKLKAMDPSERENVISQAELFDSTVMAWQFHQNGTSHFEIEMGLTNETIDQQAVAGKWQVVSVDGQQFVVRCEELAADQTVVATVDREFEFLQDGNVMSLRIPLGGILDDCDPMIVFERQVHVAGQSSDTAERMLK